MPALLAAAMASELLVGGRLLLRPTLPGRWCTRCRYDLTGSPNAIQCPECGHPTDYDMPPRRRYRVLAWTVIGVGIAIWLGLGVAILALVGDAIMDHLV